MRQYQLGIYEKAMPGTLTWEEKMQTAKEAGYDYIEISIDETDAKLSRLLWTKEERLELTALMNKTGIPIRSMCLSGHRKYPFGHPDAEVRARSLSIMEQAIDLADDLGVRIIQLAGYDVYYEEGTEETRVHFLESLEIAAAMAARKGILLGFETMETPFMNTTEKAMKYVDLVNNPYLGVYPDLGNNTNAARTYLTEKNGQDPTKEELKEQVAADLETGRGHIFAMHLKETEPGVFREMTYGTGHVDFKAGIEKAWSLGVRRYVTELWYTGSETWRDDLKNAVSMMTGYLDMQNL